MASSRNPPRNLPSPADVITNAILDRLEAGVRPWVKPWRPGSGSRPLRANGEAYRGINCFWLWMDAENRGYLSPSWMTWKQAQALGGQVRAGERSEIAIFFKNYTRKVDSPVTGESSDEQRRVLRAYRVFNADQIDNLPDEFHPQRLAAVPPSDTLSARAEMFIERLPAKVHHRGSSAFYDRVDDSITLPPIELFDSRAGWAATLAHEAAHWSGSPDRLNREFGKRFGDLAYFFEELCAEMTACLLGADLGLPVEHIDNHAAYIGSWIKVMRKDSRAIFTAAARAEEAYQYLLRATRLDEKDGGDDAERMAA